MNLLLRAAPASIAAGCLAFVIGCGLATPPTAPTPYQPPQPRLSVDGVLAFGDVPVGQTKDVTITIRNLTGASLTVTARAPQAAADVITLVPGARTVEAGAMLPLTFRFTPASSGSISASVEIVADGVNHTVSMSGTGVSATPVPAALRFVTFGFTGAPQSFTVPAGVSQITIDAFGAQGGGGCCNSGLASRSAGGSGGRIVATVAVTGGELLTILVGGAGQDGASGIAGGYNGGGSGGVSFFLLAPNGGGGGGASAVTRAATAMVIAGGGGGGGTFNGVAGGAGGAGGGTTAATGETARFSSRSPSGGAGGTQTAGGAGGGGAEFVGGGSGTLLQGGNGASDYSGGGGGGGGYFGGGGGGAGSAPAGGGGGGSSYAMPGATNVSHSQGVRAGNGQIVITW